MKGGTNYLALGASTSGETASPSHCPSITPRNAEARVRRAGLNDDWLAVPGNAVG